MATQFMEQTRAACARIEPCRREVALLEDAMRDVTPWQPRSHGGGGRGACTDPTAALAAARMEGLAKDLDAKRAECRELEDVIGRALRAIESVRRNVGQRPAGVIELYYIDRIPTWSEVGEELGVSRETVRVARDRALDWIDSYIVRHDLARLC